jgi:membrane associated rhomboid family serine protease
MFPIKNAVPSRYPPLITWSLIAANCIVFFAELSLSPRELDWFLFQFALIPARYSAAFSYADGSLSLADFLPFVTNMFLHGGWIHLILNMWTLWLFGPTIEDRLGPGRYLAFYLLCGIFASVAHVLFNPGSPVPALGASGAIAGVLGCYLRLFPLARIVVMIPILFIPLFFEVPAVVFAGLWFMMQLLQGTVELFAPSAGGGVAWWAHVGGFVAGFLLAPPLHLSVRRYRPYYADEGILGFTPMGVR